MCVEDKRNIWVQGTDAKYQGQYWLEMLYFILFELFST